MILVTGDLQILISTSGHLGRSLKEQTCTAKALGLSYLSSYLQINWKVEGDDITTPSHWSENFNIVFDLLRHIQKGRIEKSKENLQLKCVHEITLVVGFKNSCSNSLRVNARLDKDKGFLTVSGNPIRFGADAANELME